MGIRITRGLQVASVDPVDDRIVFNGRPWTNPSIARGGVLAFGYEGLMSVDTSDDSVWILSDATQGGVAAGWTQLPTSDTGAEALNDLTDVTITNESTGQSLVYNGTAWVNGRPTVSTGTGLTGDGLSSSPVQIADGGVDTTQLANNAVDNTKIADNAVRTNHIMDDNITNDKIADNAVQAAQIMNGSVGSDKIEDNAVTTAKLDVGTNEGTNGQVLTRTMTGMEWSDAAEFTGVVTDDGFLGNGTQGDPLRHFGALSLLGQEHAINGIGGITSASQLPAGLDYQISIFNDFDSFNALWEFVFGSPRGSSTSMIFTAVDNPRLSFTFVIFAGTGGGDIRFTLNAGDTLHFRVDSNSNSGFIDFVSDATPDAPSSQQLFGRASSLDRGGIRRNDPSITGGTGINITDSVSGLFTVEIPAGTANNQVLTWNGTDWAAAAVPSGEDNLGAADGVTIFGDGTSGNPYTTNGVLGGVGDRGIQSFGASTHARGTRVFTITDTSDFNSIITNLGVSLTNGTGTFSPGTNETEVFEFENDDATITVSLFNTSHTVTFDQSARTITFGSGIFVPNAPDANNNFTRGVISSSSRRITAPIVSASNGIELNRTGNTFDFSIPDGAANNDVLTWNGTTWVSQALPQAPDGGLQSVSTNATLIGNGTTANPLGLADNSVGQNMIQTNAVRESNLNATNDPTNGQILSFSGNNGFTWVDDASGGTTVTTSGAVSGDGTTGSPVTIANGAITEALINTNAVTESKLNSTNSPTNGQVLSFSGNNGFTWIDDAAGDDVSITNGAAVNNMYVSGATESNGAITLTRAALPDAVSIANGDAVANQYVSGATVSNGAITYTRASLPTIPDAVSANPSGVTTGTELRFLRIGNQNYSINDIQSVSGPNGSGGTTTVQNPQGIEFRGDDITVTQNGDIAVIQIGTPTTPELTGSLTASPNPIAIGATTFMLTPTFAGSGGATNVTARVTGPNSFSQTATSGTAIPVTIPAATAGQTFQYTLTVSADNVAQDTTARVTVSVEQPAPPAPEAARIAFTVTPDGGAVTPLTSALASANSVPVTQASTPTASGASFSGGTSDQPNSINYTYRGTTQRGVTWVLLDTDHTPMTITLGGVQTVPVTSPVTVTIDGNDYNAYVVGNNGSVLFQGDTYEYTLTY